MALLDIFVYLLLHITFFSQEASTQSITIKNSEICQRYGQSSAIVGPGLYYDGGWISKTAAKKSGDAVRENTLLAINLMDSWVASEVELFSITISPISHLTENSVLFSDRDGYLHQYGYHQGTERQFVTWFYDTQTIGSLWKSRTPKTSGLELRGDKLMVPIGNAGYAQDSNNHGYSVGGSNDGVIAFSSSVIQYTLDVTNPRVENISAGFTEMSKGALVWVPVRDGQLISIGGLDINNKAISPGTVNIFDIASKKWFHQSCTGSYPDSLISGTAVGILSQDGSSFNIYVMNPLGMFILSLPSFTWFSVPSTGNYAPWPRERPSINLAGNRQLVLYGGQDGKNCDKQIVYVFDMTALQWKQSYDADAAPYEVPSKIYNKIGGNGKGGSTLAPSEWDPEFYNLWYGESSSEPTTTRESPDSASSTPDGTQNSQGTSSAGVHDYSDYTSAGPFSIATLTTTVTASLSTVFIATSAIPSDASSTGEASTHDYNGGAENAHSHPTLPLAGIIGVSVCGFIVVIITAIIFFVCCRHYRHKSPPSPPEAAAVPFPLGNPEISELHSNEKPVYEMGTTGDKQFSSNPIQAELGGTQQLNETQGKSYYGHPTYGIQGSHVNSGHPANGAPLYYPGSS